MEIMDKKLYNKKQQQLFDTFFKEFFTWSAENIGNWIVCGILVFVHGIFMVIPYQSYQNFDEKGHYIFIVLGYMWYLMPYIRFTESRKIQNIYEKIKYMPISLPQLRIYRIKKLAVFCLKCLAVFLIGQIFFSLVIYHEITLTNISYTIVWGFLYPFGINALMWSIAK